MGRSFFITLIAHITPLTLISSILPFDFEF